MNANLKRRAQFVLKTLRPLYRDEPLGVRYETPFQLVVAVILSAQCTDTRVNLVTRKFFPRLRTPRDFVTLSQRELEAMIKPTGFFRNKAKNILGAAQMIITEHSGRIPDNMQELVRLPGFGRKTANVILTALHRKNEGVCVDTHVLRLSQRLGLTKNKSPLSVERDLMGLVPQKSWHEITHFLILHGRCVCLARSPRCAQCVLNRHCPSRKPLHGLGNAMIYLDE